VPPATMNRGMTPTLVVSAATLVVPLAFVKVTTAVFAVTLGPPDHALEPVSVNALEPSVNTLVLESESPVADKANPFVSNVPPVDAEMVLVTVKAPSSRTVPLKMSPLTDTGQFIVTPFVLMVAILADVAAVIDSEVVDVAVVIPEPKTNASRMLSPASDKVMAEVRALAFTVPTM
jgi:hypothetical protein